MRLTPGRALKLFNDLTIRIDLDETYARKGIETSKSCLGRSVMLSDETYARKGIETYPILLSITRIHDETYARKGIETDLPKRAKQPL